MRLALLTFAAVVVMAAPAAQADVLLSNLAEPPRDASVLSEDLWAAQSFVTGPDEWTLTSIRAVVGDAEGAPNVFAELREGSVTGTLLTTFTLPGFAGAESARTFTPLSTTTLSAGGLYYFILGVTGAGTSFDWGYAEGNGQTGPGAFQNFWYSEEQGADWTDFGGDNPFFLEVNGRSAAVPEPASWALMILGFGAAGAMLRTRRTRLA